MKSVRVCDRSKWLTMAMHSSRSANRWYLAPQRALCGHTVRRPSALPPETWQCRHLQCSLPRSRTIRIRCLKGIAYLFVFPLIVSIETVPRSKRRPTSKHAPYVLHSDRRPDDQCTISKSLCSTNRGHFGVQEQDLGDIPLGTDLAICVQSAGG